jgi:hypothetical protein
MEKTAVDLFAEKYNLIGTFEYEEAKVLERQQIIDAHIAGHNAPSSTLKNLDANEYYNQKFKSI